MGCLHEPESPAAVTSVSAASFPTLLADSEPHENSCGNGRATDAALPASATCHGACTDARSGEPIARRAGPDDPGRGYAIARPRSRWTTGSSPKRSQRCQAAGGWKRSVGWRSVSSGVGPGWAGAGPVEAAGRQRGCRSSARACASPRPAVPGRPTSAKPRAPSPTDALMPTVTLDAAAHLPTPWGSRHDRPRPRRRCVGRS